MCEEGWRLPGRAAPSITEGFQGQVRQNWIHPVKLHFTGTAASAAQHLSDQVTWMLLQRGQKQKSLLKDMQLEI